MDVKSPVKEREVIDFDFLFINGSKLSFTVDPEAGDAVSESDDKYIIDLKAKPGLTKEAKPLNPEFITVLKTGVIAVAQVKRLQKDPTEDELLDFQNTIQELSKTIQ